MFDWLHRTNPREKVKVPTEPEYGSVRIVPVGTAGFAVERYENRAPARARHSDTRWFRISEDGSLEEAEAIARYTLLTAHEEAENARAHEEAVRAHREANPPRVITL